MITKKQVDSITKTVNTKNIVNNGLICIVVFLFSALISYLFCLNIINRSMREVVSIGFLIFTFNFFIISGVCILVNEVLKYQSVSALRSTISKLSFGDWEWAEVALVNRPIRLHSAVMTHPVTMLIVGMLFLKEGYTIEGKTLIQKAKDLDSGIGEVEITSRINREGMKYFEKILNNEGRFKKYYSVKYILKNKYVRYFLTAFVVIILLLNFISQILHLKK